MDGIKICGLRKSFQTEAGRLDVLKKIDLQAGENDITVILGKSGCGKTTLLRLICGLETPDGGSIEFGGSPRTAYVFQEPRLMPWLNVQENTMFGLRRKERDAGEAADILRMVGLQGFEKAHPAELSGGMQHRVALARALAFHPSFLLMDEPFAALDHFTRKSMQEELLRICSETRIGVLFVTHSIDEALLLADKIVLLVNGTIRDEIVLREDRPRDLPGKAMLEARKKIMEALDT